VKDEREITFNIFRKLSAQRYFRNFFFPTVILFQAVLTGILIWNYSNYFDLDWGKPLSKGVAIGSYIVSILIGFLMFAYLCAFVMQYRSMKRLISFLAPNSRVKYAILAASFPLVIIYICGLIIALFYFWGLIGMKLTKVNLESYEFGCYSYFKESVIGTDNWSAFTYLMLWIIRVGD